MTASVDDIAEQMRAVAGDRTKSQELLASLFAESVEIRHVPPSPNDGPVPGSAIAGVAGREVQSLAQALPDAEHGDSEITVEGDAIRVRGRTTGTLTDGTQIDVRSNTLFTVADGAIVALQSEMDAESAASWRTVLEAGAAAS